MRTAFAKSRLKQFFAAFVAGGVLLACGGNADTSATSLTPVAHNQQFATITAEDLNQRLQASGEAPLVVDVREPDEFEKGHIAGAILAPLGNVEQNLSGVPKDREIILVCRSGRRSGIAAERLTARGYTDLTNMQGGMLAWEKREYPVMKPTP
ncbi:MAG TPA: rhodanese-like domain-containing protein [Thermoanaerobaculia bacterium]